MLEALMNDKAVAKGDSHAHDSLATLVRYYLLFVIFL